MNSGATHHITPNINNLNSTNSFNGNDKIAIGDGTKLPITHTGSAIFHSNNYYKNLHSKNVLCVPKISSNLVSVRKLCGDNNVFLEFYPSFFLIKDTNSNRVILQGQLENGLYTIKPTKVNSQAKGVCFAATKYSDLSNFSFSDECIPSVKL